MLYDMRKHVVGRLLTSCHMTASVEWLARIRDANAYGPSDYARTVGAKCQLRVVLLCDLPASTIALPSGSCMPFGC